MPVHPSYDFYTELPKDAAKGISYKKVAPEEVKTLVFRDAGTNANKPLTEMVELESISNFRMKALYKQPFCEKFPTNKNIEKFTKKIGDPLAIFYLYQSQVDFDIRTGRGVYLPNNLVRAGSAYDRYGAGGDYYVREHCGTAVGIFYGKELVEKPKPTDPNTTTLEKTEKTTIKK